VLERVAAQRRQALLEALIRDYQRRLKAVAAAGPGGASGTAGNAAPEDPALMGHCEYPRLVAELNRPYGTSGDGAAALSWGSHESLQLGLPDLEESDSLTYGPLGVRLPGGAAARQVAAGSLHSMALARDGTPYTWYVGARNGRRLGGGARGRSRSPDVPCLTQPFLALCLFLPPLVQGLGGRGNPRTCRPGGRER